MFTLAAEFTQVSEINEHRPWVQLQGKENTRRDNNSCHEVPQTEFIEWVVKQKGISMFTVQT